MAEAPTTAAMAELRLKEALAGPGAGASAAKIVVAEAAAMRKEHATLFISIFRAWTRTMCSKRRREEKNE